MRKSRGRSRRGGWVLTDLCPDVRGLSPALEMFSLWKRNRASHSLESGYIFFILSPISSRIFLLLCSTLEGQDERLGGEVVDGGGLPNHPIKHRSIHSPVLGSRTPVAAVWDVSGAYGPAQGYSPPTGPRQLFRSPGLYLSARTGPPAW